MILHDGLEKIRACAFGSCMSLHEIIIPDTVKSIDDESFKDCSQLTTEIGGEAFA